MLEIAGNIGRHKLRSFFTIAGVAIGIVAFVVLGSLSERLTMMVRGSEQFFAHHIRVVAQQTDYMRGFLLTDQLQLIAEQPGVDRIVRRIEIPWGQTESAFMGMTSAVVGVQMDDTTLSLLPLYEGRLFSQSESLAAVAGAALAAENEWEMGDTVQIYGHVFKIVGILHRLMTTPDHMLFVRIADAEKLFIQSNPSLQYIFDTFLTDDGTVSNVSQVVQGLATSAYIVWDKTEDPETLSQRLQKEFEDVTFISPAMSQHFMARNVTVLQMMVFSVGGVALFIGMLSIVNTMTMAVTERRSEIALKKALGATTWSIIREYVTESAVLGFLGGVVGVLVGAGVTEVLNRVGMVQHVLLFSMTGRLFVGALVFAVFIGTVAGIYPAVRAVRLDPIDGLRRL